MNLLAAFGFLSLIIQPLLPINLGGVPVRTEEGPVYVEGEIDDATLDARPPEVPIELPSISADFTEITHVIAELDLPLLQQDFYWGKYENGKAGADELNDMPILKPGDRISVIADGYVTLNPKRGYVQSQAGYYYGSGLCWSISTLGGTMDEANKVFKAKYGIDLFVFNYGDRYGHSHYYQTYLNSNHGYGYTVIKVSSGKGQVDYTFTINPKIKTIEGLENAEFRIQIQATDKHKTAYKGQALKGIVYTNIDSLSQ
ncbi:hypothetical protein JW978_00530 [Candidatus Dojkabacteria bacterium]|nr:hypothetical protein [Candidatus Dojkabacteria bacterium]